MNEKIVEQIGRREFLRAGLTVAAITTGCLRLGLREALAGAARTGKPLPTAVNLNRLLHRQSDDGIRGLGEELARDPWAFLDNRFHTTPQHRKIYTDLPPAEVEKLKEAGRRINSEVLLPTVEFIHSDQPRVNVMYTPLRRSRRRSAVPDEGQYADCYYKPSGRCTIQIGHNDCPNKGGGHGTT